MKIKSILYDMFCKYSYNYVPPCPRCKSLRTGYVIEGQHTENNEKIKLERLQMGEIVNLHAYVSDSNNLFCESCGIMWTGEIIKKRLTKEEIEIEKANRGITEDYIFERNFTKKNMKNFKKQMYQTKEDDKPVEKQKDKKNNVKVKVKTKKT